MEIIYGYFMDLAHYLIVKENIFIFNSHLLYINLD